jgi:hypothetical protein
MERDLDEEEGNMSWKSDIIDNCVQTRTGFEASVANSAIHEEKIEQGPQRGYNTSYPMYIHMFPDLQNILLVCRSILTLGTSGFVWSPATGGYVLDTATRSEGQNRAANW